MLVIPGIDLRRGRVVRLLRGAFDAVTEYSDDPSTVAKRYQSLGCKLLHVVDLDGAETGCQANLSIFRQMIDDTELEVQIGGGIRTYTRAKQMLEFGAARVVIGSLAVTEPQTVRRWLARLGPERIVLALDARIDDDGRAMVTTHGWTNDSGVSLDEAIEMYRRTGLTHVLCTDVSRDGALSGPNTELYRSLIRSFPQLRFQASGGVRDAADLGALAATGAAAAITGKALLEGRIRAKELEPYLHGE